MIISDLFLYFYKFNIQVCMNSNYALVQMHIYAKIVEHVVKCICSRRIMRSQCYA